MGRRKLSKSGRRKVEAVTSDESEEKQDGPLVESETATNTPQQLVNFPPDQATPMTGGQTARADATTTEKESIVPPPAASRRSQRTRPRPRGKPDDTVYPIARRDQFGQPIRDDEENQDNPPGTQGSSSSITTGAQPTNHHIIGKPECPTPNATSVEHGNVDFGNTNGVRAPQTDISGNDNVQHRTKYPKSIGKRDDLVYPKPKHALEEEAAALRNAAQETEETDNPPGTQGSSSGTTFGSTVQQNWQYNTERPDNPPGTQGSSSGTTFGATVQSNWQYNTERPDNPPGTQGSSSGTTVGVTVHRNWHYNTGKPECQAPNGNCVIHGNANFDNTNRTRADPTSTEAHAYRPNNLHSIGNGDGQVLPKPKHVLEEEAAALRNAAHLTNQPNVPPAAQNGTQHQNVDIEDDIQIIAELHRNRPNGMHPQQIQIRQDPNLENFIVQNGTLPNGNQIGGNQLHQNYHQHHFLAQQQAEHLNRHHPNQQQYLQQQQPPNSAAAFHPQLNHDSTFNPAHPHQAKPPPDYSVPSFPPMPGYQHQNNVNQPNMNIPMNVQGQMVHQQQAHRAPTGRSQAALLQNHPQNMMFPNNPYQDNRNLPAMYGNQPQLHQPNPSRQGHPSMNIPGCPQQAVMPAQYYQHLNQQHLAQHYPGHPVQNQSNRFPPGMTEQPTPDLVRAYKERLKQVERALLVFHHQRIGILKTEMEYHIRIVTNSADAARQHLEERDEHFRSFYRANRRLMQANPNIPDLNAINQVRNPDPPVNPQQANNNPNTTAVISERMVQQMRAQNVNNTAPGPQHHVRARSNPMEANRENFGSQNHGRVIQPSEQFQNAHQVQNQMPADRGVQGSSNLQNHHQMSQSNGTVQFPESARLHQEFLAAQELARNANFANSNNRKQTTKAVQEKLASQGYKTSFDWRNGGTCLNQSAQPSQSQSLHGEAGHNQHGNVPSTTMPPTGSVPETLQRPNQHANMNPHEAVGNHRHCSAPATTMPLAVPETPQRSIQHVNMNPHGPTGNNSHGTVPSTTIPPTAHVLQTQPLQNPYANTNPNGFLYHNGLNHGHLAAAPPTANTLPPPSIANSYPTTTSVQESSMNVNNNPRGLLDTTPPRSVPHSNQNSNANSLQEHAGIANNRLSDAMGVSLSMPTTPMQNRNHSSDVNTDRQEHVGISNNCPPGLTGSAPTVPITPPQNRNHHSNVTNSRDRAGNVSTETCGPTESTPSVSAVMPTTNPYLNVADNHPQTRQNYELVRNADPAVPSTSASSHTHQRPQPVMHPQPTGYTTASDTSISPASLESNFSPVRVLLPTNDQRQQLPNTNSAPLPGTSQVTNQHYELSRSVSLPHAGFQQPSASQVPNPYLRQPSTSQSSSDSLLATPTTSKTRTKRQKTGTVEDGTEPEPERKKRSYVRKAPLRKEKELSDSSTLQLEENTQKAPTTSPEEPKNVTKSKTEQALPSITAVEGFGGWFSRSPVVQAESNSFRAQPYSYHQQGSHYHPNSHQAPGGSQNSQMNQQATQQPNQPFDSSHFCNTCRKQISHCTCINRNPNQ